jgi:hypothetical protein
MIGQIVTMIGRSDDDDDDDDDNSDDECEINYK